ncbi:MAG: hypothetical protein AB8G99_05595 [Planctomycetaceae bacterium]
MNRFAVFSLVVGAAIAVASTQTNSANASQAGQNTKTGRYALSSAGDSAVLLDTQTGDSWYLQVQRGNPGKPLWIAIKRQQDGQGNVRGNGLEKSALERQMLEAQLALEKLKDDFGPRHPQVVQKQREIDMIKKMLSGAR